MTAQSVDLTKPALTDSYTAWQTELVAAIQTGAALLDPTYATPSNQPVGTKRFNSGSGLFEQWSGTAWGTLPVNYLQTTGAGTQTVTGTVNFTGALQLAGAGVATTAAVTTAITSALGSYSTTATSNATYAALATNQTWTGQPSFGANQTGGISNQTGSLGGLIVEANGGLTATAGQAAFMTFLRQNSFGAYFGLDTDNQFAVGGWSFGATRHVLLHDGNYTSYAPSLTGGGANGTWGINITGSAASATNATYWVGGSPTFTSQSAAPGTTYTNSFGRTLIVYGFVDVNNNTTLGPILNGNLLAVAGIAGGNTAYIPVTIVVPPGYTWRINSTTAHTAFLLY